MKKLEEYVRAIPDFPEEGIIFRDVTSVLQDADGLQLAIDTMQKMVSDLDYDVVVGAESRGRASSPARRPAWNMSWNTALR